MADLNLPCASLCAGDLKGSSPDTGRRFLREADPQKKPAHLQFPIFNGYQTILKIIFAFDRNPKLHNTKQLSAVPFGRSFANSLCPAIRKLGGTTPVWQRVPKAVPSFQLKY
jgi:hypothetical protein